MKKLLLSSVLALALLFVTASPARAEYIVYNQSSSAGEWAYFMQASGGGAATCRLFAFTFENAVSEGISTSTLNIQDVQSLGQIYSVWAKIRTSSSTVNDLNVVASSTVRSISGGVSNFEGIQHIGGWTQYASLSASQYFFELCATFQDNAAIDLYANNSDGFADGPAGQNGTQPYLILTSSGDDPTLPYIAFNAPPVPLSTQPSFSQWNVEIRNTHQGAGIKINVCPILTNCARFDVFPGQLATNAVPRDVIVPMSGPLNAGTQYTAIAYLYTSTTTLATSSVTFQVYGAGPGTPTGFSTSTFQSQIDSLNARLTVDCSAYTFFTMYDVFGYDVLPWPNIDDFMPGTFCYSQKVLYGAINVVLVPDEPFIAFIDDGVGLFKSVFPFNIFFDVQSIASNIAAENSVGEGSSITTPAAGPIPQITILSSTTLAAAVGQETRDLWFELAAYMMWASAGIAIVYGTAKLLR